MRESGRKDDGDQGEGDHEQQGQEVKLPFPYDTMFPAFYSASNTNEETDDMDDRDR